MGCIKFYYSMKFVKVYSEPLTGGNNVYITELTMIFNVFPSRKC